VALALNPAGLALEAGSTGGVHKGSLSDVDGLSIVVQAVAGSNPVVHPSESPAKAGVFICRGGSSSQVVGTMSEQIVRLKAAVLS
jgi:hypothetical protein